MAVTKSINIGAYLGVPIRLLDGVIVGTLCALDPEPQHFSPAHVQFMQILANQVGVLLERETAFAPTTVPALPYTLIPQVQNKTALPEGLFTPVKIIDYNVATAKKGYALIFDDTKLDRRPIAGLVELSGYAVREFKQTVSFEALEREVQALRPGLLVVAATTPAEESIDVIRQLRQSQRIHSLPIIFLYKQRVTSVKAYYAGASLCLMYNSDADNFLEELAKLESNTSF